MKRFKQILAIVIALVMTVTAGLGNGITCEAKSSGWKKEVAHWGIYPGRVYRFPAYYYGVHSEKELEWYITRPRVTEAKKDFYNKMVFEMNLTNMSDFSPEEAEALVTQVDRCGGYAWFLVDEKTGYTLSTKNKKKVTAKVTVLEKKKINRYPALQGTRFFRPIRRVRLQVTLVYPEFYEGMYFGIGTLKKPGTRSASDKKFYKGKLPIDQTSMFQKNKKTLRFMPLNRFQEY